MKQKKILTYDQKLKRFLIPVLRHKSLYWTGRQEAKADARVARGFYECASCSNLFGQKEIELDHKIPIINVKTSFTTWDDYIRSLFCDKTNFQVLCSLCHKQKTMTENALREIHKKSKKKNK